MRFKKINFKNLVVLAILIVLALVVCFGSLPVLAEDDQGSQQEKLTDLREKIEQYEQKIADLQGQQQTLGAAIDYLNNKINLTTAQVAATEQELEMLGEEISKLTTKIGLLDKSLTEVSYILGSRIEETYKRSFVNPFYLVLSSDRFSQVFARLKYLRTAQAHDREILFQMQKSKMNYNTQKELKKEKQVEEEELKKKLEAQKLVLAQQKKEKAFLLEETENDEAEYQRLLAAARAEFQAIQAILAGQGDEEEVRQVSEGEVIATLIEGKSCNSSDTHLHFTVAKQNPFEDDYLLDPLDPFRHLKPVDHRNCSSCFSNQNCPCDESDPFNPSGSWNWPLDPPIILTQGYGNTWAVSHTWVGQIYSFHNGIDIVGSSNQVKAVRAGMLYQGSYTGRGGCSLPYVKVKHEDSDLETYYLHVYD